MIGHGIFQTAISFNDAVSLGREKGGTKQKQKYNE